MEFPGLRTTVPYLSNPRTKANQAFLNFQTLSEVQNPESKDQNPESIKQYKDKYKTYLLSSLRHRWRLESQPAGTGPSWPSEYGKPSPGRKDGNYWFALTPGS
jgi:hypothetical protein